MSAELVFSCQDVLDVEESIGDIWGVHGEFCISTDNCDCGERSERLERLASRMERTLMTFTPEFIEERHRQALRDDETWVYERTPEGLVHCARMGRPPFGTP